MDLLEEFAAEETARGHRVHFGLWYNAEAARHGRPGWWFCAIGLYPECGDDIRAEAHGATAAEAVSRACLDYRRKRKSRQGAPAAQNGSGPTWARSCGAKSS
jgi:hypothetical protein